MIKSMTGFGRAEVMEENRKFTVEIKSVNHRYFDVNIKMPKKLGFFESTIRNLLKEYMQRGKVDVFITYEDYNENNVALKYNEEIAREYLTHLNFLSICFLKSVYDLLTHVKNSQYYFFYSFSTLNLFLY